MKPTTTVEIAFDLAAAGVDDFFTLNDSVKGELDNTTYKLAGDILTDVTSDVRSVSLRRGRSRQLEQFQAGSCDVVLDNRDRDYDPTNGRATDTRTNLAVNPSFEVDLTNWSTGSSYFTVGETTRQNLATNPSFESGLDLWTTDATDITTSGAVAAVTSVRSQFGSQSASVVCSASATTEGLALPLTGLEYDTTYRISGYVWPQFGYTAYLNTEDTTGGVAGSTSASAAAETWTRLDSTLTTGSDARFVLDTDELDDAAVFLASGDEVEAVVSFTGQLAGGSYFTLDDPVLGELGANQLGPEDTPVFHVDGVLVEKTSDLDPYFDGSVADSSLNDGALSWDGATGLSTSTLTWVIPTISQSSGQVLWENASALVEVNTRFANQGIFTTISGLSAAETYTISMYAYVQQGSDVVLSTRDTTNGVSGSTSSATGSASWVRLSSEITTGAAAADVLVALYTTSDYLVPGSGPFSTFYVDGLLVEQGSELLAYFDGSVADGSLLNAVTQWNGTAHDSTSQVTFEVPGTGSPYFPSVKPRKAIRVLMDGFPAFFGVVEDWDFQYSQVGDATATTKAVDGFGVLSRTEISPRSFGEQATGDRVASVLSLGEVNWSAAQRDLDTGQATVGAQTLTDPENTLAYLQDVELAEPGALFISKDGNVTFRDRTASQLSPAVVFADDGTGVPFLTVEIQYGTEELRNRVTINREGGSDIVVTDADSIGDYGVFDYKITDSLLADDSQVQELADYLVGRYAEPYLRIDSVSLDFDRLSSEQTLEVLALELGAVGKVVFTPGGVGDPIERYVTVDAIQHDVTAGDHRVTFDLSEAVPSFTLGSAEFGVLGQNKLGF